MKKITLIRNVYRIVEMSALIALLLMTSPFTPASQAGGFLSMPEDMAYVPFQMAIIGIDKEKSKLSAEKNEPLTLFEKRMNMPWSKEAFHDEGPAHWVLLNSYFIDKYEVSNEKYARFMKETRHPAPAYWDDPRLNQPGQPVVGVNWNDAVAFCGWEGKRLPTEAEWEHAARGPQGLRYPWGTTFDHRKVNFERNHDRTLPVDSLPEGRSPYGLHHMSGNVFEWVNDWYDPQYYSKGPFPPDPTGPSKAIWLGGTGTYVDRLTVGEKKVVRGGSWIAAKHTVTSTHRFWNHPLNNSYGVGLGFRCAMTAPASVEEELRTAMNEAMKNMGLERYQEAGDYIERALKMNPHNEIFLQLKGLVDAALKNS